MAHPLRTIASGTLLLFHSENVTSTSRSNLSFHMSNIPGINTTHPDHFLGYYILPKYPLLCCLLQYTLWWLCEWPVKFFQAILLQNSSSVVVLADQVIPGCWYWTFQLVLVQFPLSQTFFHFVQLLTPFLEAHINQKDQLHFTLCNFEANILGWKWHQHSKWYCQVAALMLAAYSTCQSVNNIYLLS